MSKTQAPYGSWPSAISAESLASSSIRYGHIQTDNGGFYWLQSQPENNGRQTILCYQADAEVKDVIPADYSVRSRLHEYGGGDFAVHDGTIVFANDADQRLYCLSDGVIRALTPEPAYRHGLRYSDMHFHPSGEWLVAVRERHPENHDPQAVINDIVSIDITSGTVTQLISGDDFYAYPRIAHSGDDIAWVSWNHPDMPWDNTTLYRAKVSKTAVSDVTAYMEQDEEAIYQPSWCPDGELHFVSDRSNWWNIYSLRDNLLNALTPMVAEFGFPMWQLGIRSYQFLSDDRIAALISHDGYEQLCIVETDSGHIVPCDLPFCYFQSGIQLEGDTLYFIAAADNLSTAVYRYDYITGVLNCISGQPEPANKAISRAQSMYFPTANDERAHAFFYQPLNSDFAASEAEKPPVIVMIHGGPTGATSAAYQTAIQFWTSRGFAVIDVNHRGSTGFGRAYRNALRFQWGITEVEDCIAVIDHLISEQLIDPDRVAIRGGSAGGYTVYRALQSSDRFKAGMSRYGVADLTALAKDTHKFELRYLDRLIGAYPEQAERYQELSPLNHSDKFSCPLLLLQGDEDAIVPPSQSIAMAEALNSKGIPHQLVILEGEQHGFRQKHNVIKALELELNFYRQVFAIAADETLAELQLEHSEQLLR